MVITASASRRDQLALSDQQTAWVVNPLIRRASDRSCVSSLTPGHNQTFLGNARILPTQVSELATAAHSLCRNPVEVREKLPAPRGLFGT